MTDNQCDSEQEDSQMTREQWLPIRKEAAAKIDPETSEVMWQYGSGLDPYGLHDLPVDAENNYVERNYFARSAESEVWVWFGDLRAAVRDALWEKHESQLVAFPGLVSIEVNTAIKPRNLIVGKGKVRPNTIYVLVGLGDKKPDKAVLFGWEWGHTLLKAPTKDFGYGVLNHYIPRNELRPMSELKAHRAAWQAWQSVMGRSHGRA